MAGRSFLFALALVGLASGFPRISVGELFTASWCGACNSAFQFLVENQVLWEDSAVVLRMHVGDGLEISGNNLRWNYYADYTDDMSYVPHMFIDGDDYGPDYSSWILAMLSHAAEESYLGIETFDHTFDSIGVRVFLEEEGHDGEYRLLAVLTVDSLSDGGHTYNWVVQRYYTSALGDRFDLAYGDTVEFHFAFDLEPEWDPHGCIFVAYVVAPEPPTIINAVKDTVWRRPDYEFRTLAPQRKTICPAGEGAEFTLTIQNLGLMNDTYHLQIVPVELPPDWSVCMFSGDSETDVLVLSMSDYDVPITVDAPTPGVCSFGVVVHTDALAERYDTLFFSVGAGLDNLIVNDSGEPDSAEYLDFFAARDEVTFYWNTSTDGALPPFSSLGIGRVIWYAGRRFLGVFEGDARTQMRNYILSMGGRALISGAGIGRACSGDFAFYSMALGAQYGGTTTGITTASALEGFEPISGWSGGLSATDTFEVIDPSTAFGGIQIITYGDGTGAGVAKDDGSARVVYLGFPLEELTTHTAFEGLMERCIRFLDEGFSAVFEAQKPARPELSVMPNPFNSSCVIRAFAGAEIEIRDLEGRLVECIRLSPARSRFLWRPEGSLPAGVYVVCAKDGHRRELVRLVYVK